MDNGISRHDIDCWSASNALELTERYAYVDEDSGLNVTIESKPYARRMFSLQRTQEPEEMGRQKRHRCLDHLVSVVTCTHFFAGNQVITTGRQPISGVFHTSSAFGRWARSSCS